MAMPLQPVCPAFALVLALAHQWPRHPAPPDVPPAGGARDSTRVERVYGVPEPIDLWTLTAGQFQRHTVVTRGRVGHLDPRGRYFTLAEENGRVVVFGVPEISAQISPFLGKRVEVVGLVRELVASQGTCLFRMQQVPQSVCDDPELPPTPDLTRERISWPRTSITIWSITDVTPLDGPLLENGSEQVLGGKPGAKVSLRGRFGGANLDKVLATPAPEPDAWVLLADEGAVWVMGKAPRGNGWRFDPGYRGDLGKWLQVEGTLARCGARNCVRARRVLLGTPAGGPKP